MSFVQEKIDRSSDQSRGIFNKYVYVTPDTIEQIQAAGYFAACRFAVIDGPDTNSNGWHNGIIEAHCSDGYVIGTMDGATGTFNLDFEAPSEVIQLDILVGYSVANQVPAVLGEAMQISFGDAQSTDAFDLAADGTILCKQKGNYRFVFTTQTGRIGAGGVVNLYLRLLFDGAQVGRSVLARMDDAATIVPLRFNLILDLEAGQVVTAECIQDASGVAGGGGLYAVQPTEPGWLISPSASVDISQLRTNV